jgi:hypothetical protein
VHSSSAYRKTGTQLEEMVFHEKLTDGVFSGFHTTSGPCFMSLLCCSAVMHIANLCSSFLV